MGNTASTQVSIAALDCSDLNTSENIFCCVAQVVEPAEGIVTVNTQGASNPPVEDSILRRLEQLPQVW